MASDHPSPFSSGYRRPASVLMHLISVSILLLVCTAAIAEQAISAIDDSVKKYVSTYRTEDSDWSVNGKVYEGHAMYITFLNDFDVQMNVKGFDYFTGYLAIPDNKKSASKSSIVVKVDEQEVKQVIQRKGSEATFINLPLTGKNTLRITMTEGSYIWLINPMLGKGKSPDVAGTQPSPNTVVTADGIKNTPQASFVIDPNDLDKLSASLRKRVDAKPDIQQKLVKGFMAVMTFNLIDISSPSVAQNVAEDLSTRMINADFNLVERGQLDKALKELKIQDSGMIDQATAQKLGQITGCNFILVGSVSDRGQFIVMNARILETATGKAVAAESVECRKIEIKR